MLICCIYLYKEKLLPTYKEIYCKVIGIGLHNYEGWEVPRYVIRKLKTLESHCVVRSSKAREHGVHAPLSVKVWGPGVPRAEDGCLSPAVRSSLVSTFLSLPSLFCWGPQGTGWWPPTRGRAICFPQTMDSDAYIFQKPLQGHTQK